MTKNAEAKKPSDAEVQSARTPSDTSHLKSFYANFCNANSTREEVVLNFGVNKTWERGPQGTLEIELTTASC